MSYPKKPKVSLRVVKQVVIDSKSYMYPKSAANAWARYASIRAWRRWSQTEEVQKEYAAASGVTASTSDPDHLIELNRKSYDKHDELFNKAVQRSLPIFTKMLKG